MKKKFTVRNLNLLSKRLNSAPPAANEDWRSVAFSEFDLNEQQKEFLDSLPSLDGGRHYKHVQKMFSAALDRVRAGATLKLRLRNDAYNNRRELYLDVADGAIPDAFLASNETGAIVCCCADCSHWHICGGNPCVLQQ
jgi:hypothetical protein